MSNSIEPKNLVKKIESLFGGAPIVLFLGANHNIEQYPDLIRKPWSCIVTSSRDPSLLTKFVKSNPRKIISLSEKKEKITFNRKQLPIIYLNGIAEDIEDHDEDLDEEVQREETRDKLLAEFAKAANTSFSTILFTGYNEVDYEIPPKILYKSFRYLNHKSLLLFGIEVDKNIEFEELVSKGIATAYEYDLGELFSDYGKDYTDDYNEEPIFETDEDKNPYFYINGKVATIAESALRGFLPYGQLLTTSIMKAGKVSYNLITEWFYKFLKESCSEPQWYGYDPKWRFSFKREFEDKLYEVVSNEIKPKTRQKKPIVLCGQTCSGKSIALASLAWRFFDEKKIPIIYIQKQNLPTAKKTEWKEALKFLIEALNAIGAEEVILIWDASFYNLAREEQLSQLQIEFENLGKKIIIIASAMEQQPSSKEDKEKIYNTYKIFPIPVNLLPEEKKLLKNFLCEKGKIERNQLEKWFENNKQEENLLALLYKLVFQIHPELEISLCNEIKASIKDRTKTIEELTPRELIDSEPTAMALQLMKLGYTPNRNTNGEFGVSIDWESKLVLFYRLLAICSQYSLNIPITLAVAFLGIDSGAACRKIIFNSPSFKFYEDTDYHSGEYTISFRTPVEAAIYLADVNQKEKFETIVELIKMASLDIYSNDVDFIVQVLREVGPNLESGKSNSEYFPMIIEVLRDLRLKDNILEPGLIIQEVVYIREFYKEDSEPQKRAVSQDIETCITKLKEAVELSKSELDMMKKELYNSAKHSLSVEYIICWLELKKICKNNNRKELPFDLPFDEAYDQLKDVIYENPNSSYPYVALMRLLISKIEDEENNNVPQYVYKYIGWVCSIIDSVDNEFPEVAQNNSFNIWKNYFYIKFDLLFGSNQAEKYCVELLEDGNPIGLYLKVSNLLRKNKIDLNKIDPKEKIKNEQLAICKEAIDILEDKRYLEISLMHPGCRYTLLRLKYLYYNKEPIISVPIERQRPCLVEKEWEEIYDLAAHFVDNILPYNPKLVYKHRILYTQALAAAQLGQYTTAEEIFDKIDNDNKKNDNFYAPIRIKTWHLLCDEHGKLREFTGRFKKTNAGENEKGYLQVKGFQKGVFYSNKKILLATGSEDALDDLCIGMSFIGFVAYNKNHSIITEKR